MQKLCVLLALCITVGCGSSSAVKADRFFKQKEYQQAVSMYTHAIHGNSADLELYHKRAKAYFRMNDHVMAIADLDKYLKRSDTKPYEILLLKGRSFLGLKEYEKAVAVLTQCVQVDSKRPEAFKFLGDAYYRQDASQMEIAAANYSRAIDLDPKFIQFYTDHTGVPAEEDILLLQALADFYYTIRNSKQAEKVYTVLLNNDPDTAENYFKRGVSRFLNGEPKQAVEDYDKAISTGYDKADVYMFKATALNKTGKYKESIEACDNALKKKPDVKGAYFFRAGAHYQLKNIDQAIADYKKEIGLNPSSADAYLSLGHIYFEQEQYNQAHGEYAKAFGLNPLDSFSAFCLGQADMGLGKFESALSYFSKSLKLKPDNMRALFYKAVAQDKLNKKSEALESYKKALTIPDTLSKDTLETIKERIRELEKRE